MTTDPGFVRLLAADEDMAAQLRRLEALRADKSTSVVIEVAGASPSDVVHKWRGGGAKEPIGFVTRDEAGAFEAIASGADDARTWDGLDLSALIAFVDRVSLRARQRQDAENRRAAVAHGEKLAALGTVVAGVAHELNNPLAGVRLCIEVIRAAVLPLVKLQEAVATQVERGMILTPDELAAMSKVGDNAWGAEEWKGTFDDLVAQFATIEGIVRGLRIFAHAEEAEKLQPVHLPELITQVLRIVGKHITVAANATIEHDYKPNELPLLLLPRGRVTQVFTNLIINAAQAMQAIKRDMHRLRISMRCDGESVVVSISDTGPGIPPDIVERIFDPFFTTKKVGEQATGGSGLGLSVSKAIMQELGGDLIVESVHGEGATFVMVVPTEGRVVDRSRVVKSKNPPPPLAEARSSILVIDDEEALLRSVAMALRGRFDVMLASDGQEAIELLESGSKPDAILCDVVMPVVDGPKFYEWLVGHHPELVGKTVFITANPDSAAPFLDQLDKPYLEKPVSRDRLIGTLEGLVGSKRPSQNPGPRT